MNDEQPVETPAPAEEPEKFPDEPHRMGDEALREFVLGVCDGRIFTSAHLSDADAATMLGSVFLLLSLGAFTGASREYLEKIGVIWEYLSKAGPMAINGFPTFLSMHVMHADDWTRAHADIAAENYRRKSFSI